MASPLTTARVLRTQGCSGKFATSMLVSYAFCTQSMAMVSLRRLRDGSGIMVPVTRLFLMELLQLIDATSEIDRQLRKNISFTGYGAVPASSSRAK